MEKYLNIDPSYKAIAFENIVDECSETDGDDVRILVWMKEHGAHHILYDGFCCFFCLDRDNIVYNGCFGDGYCLNSIAGKVEDAFDVWNTKLIEGGYDSIIKEKII